MIKWILSNKEWLFSGIGLSVIFGIWWLISRFRHKYPKPPVVIPQVPKALEYQADEYKSHPLPQEIMKDIDNRPLLQQKETAEHYVGLKVKWRVKLQSIIEGKIKGTFSMLMNPSDEMLPHISCYIKKDQYPQLKIAKKGIEFWIYGEISSADYEIELSNVSLQFD